MTRLEGGLAVILLAVIGCDGTPAAAGADGGAGDVLQLDAVQVDEELDDAGNVIGHHDARSVDGLVDQLDAGAELPDAAGDAAPSCPTSTCSFITAGHGIDYIACHLGAPGAHDEMTGVDRACGGRACVICKDGTTLAPESGCLGSTYYVCVTDCAECAGLPKAGP